MGLFNFIKNAGKAVNSNLGDDDTCIYDENVDYEALEQHTYSDTPGYTFYTCPKCGGEYLATFIIEEDGETMCIDCAS